jgi:hypothetical protein
MAQIRRIRGYRDRAGYAKGLRLAIHPIHALGHYRRMAYGKGKNPHKNAHEDQVLIFLEPVNHNSSLGSVCLI